MPASAPLVALFTAIVLAGPTVLAGFPEAETALNESRRVGHSLGQPALPPGCLYEERWYTEGAIVSTGEACLHCACYHGALTCRRRSCTTLPDPPPRRCHVLHRRGSCCPELHCPDGTIMMEHGASARSENEEDINAPVSIAHACVEGGTVYAAGSAMRSTVACEQCFCLGGARRCVRPRCLPPPPGCKPRPAAGACCPQRYYCEHRTTKPPEEKHPHDCKVDGKWISEGEKIVSQKTSSNCTQCFCLRGAVQCQPLFCAPPLLGCKPLLRPGECCAHQYHCERTHQGMPHFLGLTSNALTSARNDHEAFKNSPNTKETTTKTTLASIYLVKNTRITSAINNLVSTTKVKRKTSDPPPPPIEVSSPPGLNTTEAAPTKLTEEPTTVAKLIATTESTPTTELTTETTTTEQPESSVRITVNGTINCTAELSSTSLPLNVTFNDTDTLEKITMESHPRVPLIDVSNLEDHTFSPNDIITDRNINGGFDENESFIINVTSSLRTNTSHTSTTKPLTTKPAPITTKVSLPTNIVDALNSSKKTKGDYDYDYNEPTLPPSLPNLKIIPFVAADAVLENEQAKETLTSYPIHEREDKFPVYYPSINAKETSFTRREDVYHSTQYPVFITEKGEEQYPSLTQEVDLTSTGYSNAHSDLSISGNEYTVPENLGSRISDLKKTVTQSPLSSTTYKVKTPAVNLFSPPVETEGGFVPKGPSGLIDEYYAVFPSTPAGPAVPHLTTSMQLDIAKGECISGDGRHIPEGDTFNLACSECTCAWGELHCSPRSCHTPSGCRRRPASSNSGDLCCGELICDDDNKTTPTPEINYVKQSTSPKNNDVKNETDILKNATVYNPTIVNDNKTNNYEPIDDIVSNKTIHQNVSNIETANKVQVESAQNFTPTTTETMKKFTLKQNPTTTSEPPKEPEQEEQPLEYEEEEDDGSFSFGNVLKLLLSGDSYDTTTTAPKIQPITSKPSQVRFTTTTRRPRPTLPPVSRPTVAPFVPMPHHPFIPPKIPQNPINRIDHLVLGEATAIKRTTLRPVATSPRPTSTRPVTRETTQRIVTKTTEATRKEDYTTTESPRPPGGLSGLGSGLLKLAGCNIYGQMYRVGRIIAELSTPCQECWCTEFGVQCKQLKC